MSSNTGSDTGELRQPALAAFREQCIQNRLEAIYTNENASSLLRRTCARISRERMGGKREREEDDIATRTPEAWAAVAMRMLVRCTFPVERDITGHSPFCVSRCAPQWVRDQLYSLALDAVDKALDIQATDDAGRYEDCWSEAFEPTNDKLWELILRCYRPEYMDQQSWVAELLVHCVLRSHQPIDSAEIKRTDFIRNMERRKPGFYSSMYRYRRPLSKIDKARMMRRNQFMFVPSQPDVFQGEEIEAINKELEVVAPLQRHLSLHLMDFMLESLESQGFPNFEAHWRITYPEVKQPLPKSFLKPWVQDKVVGKWSQQYVESRADTGFQFERYSPFYIYGDVVDDETWQVPESNLTEWEMFDSEGPSGRICRGLELLSPPERSNLRTKFMWRLAQGGDIDEVHDFIDLFPHVQKQIQEIEKRSVAKRRRVQKELEHDCPNTGLSSSGRYSLESIENGGEPDEPIHELSATGQRLLQIELHQFMQLNEANQPSAVLQQVLEPTQSRQNHYRDQARQFERR